MTSLMKCCMKTAAVLGVAVVAAGCGRRDEYGSSGTASPGTGTYSSPEAGTYASPGTGTTGSGTMASTPVSVQVVSVDSQANTITVTEAMGSGTGGTTTGETTGSAANRRTLTVDAAARTELASVKPGDQVMITCADMMGGTGTTGTGTTGTGTGTGSTGMSGTTGTGMSALTNCTTVASITPDTTTSGRGR